MTIKELTPAQIALFPRYIEEGIAIGLATEGGKEGEPFDAEEVRRLTDEHRVLCGLQPATFFFVEDSPFAVIQKYKGTRQSNALYGQHDISWLMFNQFFRRECGLLKETEKTVKLFELAKRTGWMWMSSNATVVTLRPTEIHLKETATVLSPSSLRLKVLHNESDMALKYRDGTGIYALNGTRIPEEFSWIVTTPAEGLNPKEVMRISNTTVRTEAIKKFGIERLADKLGKKVLHTDEVFIPARLTEYYDEETGEFVPSVIPDTISKYNLVSVRLGGEERIYLEGSCPSSGSPFFEAVHPECRTVGAALNWREREILVDGYEPPAART